MSMSMTYVYVNNKVNVNVYACACVYVDVNVTRQVTTKRHSSSVLDLVRCTMLQRSCMNDE